MLLFHLHVFIMKQVAGQGVQKEGEHAVGMSTIVGIAV
jgi:hypothetical protein